MAFPTELVSQPAFQSMALIEGWLWLRRKEQGAWRHES